MVRIYYYLFYRLYTFAKWTHTGVEEWTAMLFVTALVYFNFMTILSFLLDIGKVIEFLGPNVFAIVAMVPLALINYFILFHKGKSKRIISLFKKESKLQKVISSILTVMYVVVTLVLAHR